MGWANPVDPVKFIQSNPKKWVVSDNWVDMGLKKKTHTKNQVSGKTGPNPKSPLNIFYKNPQLVATCL
jgi:hypothetical protein